MATWDSELAQQAADAAEQEIRVALEKMTPEERKGAMQIIAWQKRWYNGASGQHPTGHKALGRILIKL